MSAEQQKITLFEKLRKSLKKRYLTRESNMRRTLNLIRALTVLTLEKLHLFCQNTNRNGQLDWAQSNYTMHMLRQESCLRTLKVHDIGVLHILKIAFPKVI